VWSRRVAKIGKQFNLPAESFAFVGFVYLSQKALKEEPNSKPNRGTTIPSLAGGGAADIPLGPMRPRILDVGLDGGRRPTPNLRETNRTSGAEALA
jgi:hypothetical protein